MYWKKIRDKEKKDGGISLSGHVRGIFSRTTERYSGGEKMIGYRFLEH